MARNGTAHELEMFVCEKAGCGSAATVHVVLNAADGSDTWWACDEHAAAFQRWVETETYRQLGQWASVEVTHL